jgi:PAS domain S-box-containing protein
MATPPKPPRPPVADADEDPNVVIACSSPPCFMHELDPAWLKEHDSVSTSEFPPEELARLGQALLQGGTEAIILADREGIIRFWNPGAERLFGHPAAEALGRSLDIIIPEPQRARHWAGFHEVMRTGHSRYGEGELLAVPGIRRDGSRLSLEFTVLPLHDAEGRMEGIAAVLRDVTKRFEEVRSLRRQLAAAQGKG